MSVYSVFVWEDNYSLGIDRFDEDHRQIINMMNRLVVEGFPGVESRLLHDVLNEMTNLFLGHFKDEEAFLRLIGFEGYEEHKRQHDRFIAQTARFCNAALLRKKGLGEEVYRFLYDWFLNHILEEDRKYRTKERILIPIGNDRKGS